MLISSIAHARGVPSDVASAALLMPGGFRLMLHQQHCSCQGGSVWCCISSIVQARGVPSGVASAALLMLGGFRLVCLNQLNFLCFDCVLC